MNQTYKKNGMILAVASRIVESFVGKECAVMSPGFIVINVRYRLAEIYYDICGILFALTIDGFT